MCQKIVSQVVEKFDDLRKFVDTDGVKQHMQATRSLSTSTHPSLIVHLPMFFLKIGCHSFQWFNIFRIAAAKLVKSLVGSVASLKEATEDAAEKTWDIFKEILNSSTSSSLSSFSGG